MRTSLEVVPDALEGGWGFRAGPQPFRFKLEDADVRASKLERGKHDSQLHLIFLVVSLLVTTEFGGHLE